jgi:hypothetical protein
MPTMQDSDIFRLPGPEKKQQVLFYSPFNSIMKEDFYFKEEIKEIKMISLIFLN